MLAINSWGSRWEVRTKIVTCFLSAFGIIALQEPVLLSLAFICLFVCTITMGFSGKFILSKLALLTPFLAIMTLPIILADGIFTSIDGYLFALTLSLKALNALLLMIIMVLSQQLQVFLTGLGHMHLPPFFVSILFLSMRYTFLLWEKLKNFHKFLLARLFKASCHKYTFKIYGDIIGSMLVKSIDRSEKVYQAMISRGFSGTLPVSNPAPITKFDFLKSLSFINFIILLHLIEKW